MVEVTSMQAAQLIGCTDETIRLYVERGVLAARREGMKRRIRIELDELRRFAREYEFRFDDAAAERIAQQ